MISGKKVKDIVNLLYNNNNIHLDRKYNKAMYIINNY